MLNPEYTIYSDDEILIRDIRNRENKAFEYIHSKCFAIVLQYVINMSGSYKDAEDIYSDNIANLITVVDNPALEVKKSIITLFLVMCKNRLINEYERKVASENFLKYNSETSYEENFEEKMDNLFYQNIFYNSFQKLKKDCRKIIKKSLEGISLAEIAKAMKLDYNYLRKKKRSCHQNLLELVQKNPEYRQVMNKT